ncbi:MAG: ATP-binding protein [Gammaproteobacteria bacterium]
MKRLSTFFPAGLARRFALAAAGLAAGALLLTSLASWWLINRQHQDALTELANREREFHAAAVGSQLQALAARMTEVASSTILATGLVDSAGRETYLVPFLTGMRQINGVPVQVSLTDFEGKEIANNGNAKFTPAELEWLRRELESGRPNSIIVGDGAAAHLVALAPMTYARTASPEGALLYKISLNDVHLDEGMRLEWGALAATASTADVAAVPVPPVFAHLNLRVRGSPAGFSSGTLTPQYLAVVLIAAILFATVVIAGVALARLLTRDLHRLQGFATKVVSSGLSGERATVAGSTEVASLALSVNEMLDRLQEQHAALVREREKLHDLAEALTVADRRKDEFLAMLAHELRNPLAPIAYSLDLMKKADQDHALQAKSRAIVERQMRHLVRLVDDLLDVSRITRGKLELRKEPIALKTVIEQAIEACRAQIEAAGHTLHVTAPPAPLIVNADTVRLVQVVSNLLNNATKYTPAGGNIFLELAHDEHTVTIKVRDTGTGIAPDMIERVFDLFTRGESSPERAGGGLGIGLTLAKRLTELHGGTLSVSSDGIGRGSEFAVRLPLADTLASDAATATASPPLPGGRRVLVVDDNPDTAQSLATLLELSGNETRIGYDGAEALALAGSYQPDTILLDIGLPKMDGYEVCREIRKRAGGDKVFIVAITGWGQAQDRRQSQQAGFDAHLVKPVDYETLSRLFAQAPAASQSAAG